MDAITYADQLHQTRMERSSALLLAVLRGKKPAPTNLRWDDGAYKGSPHARRYPRVADKMAARDAMAEIQRTNRDACPLCAVRADIGCKHRRAA